MTFWQSWKILALKILEKSKKTKNSQFWKDQKQNDQAQISFHILSTASKVGYHQNTASTNNATSPAEKNDVNEIDYGFHHSWAAFNSKTFTNE